MQKGFPGHTDGYIFERDNRFTILLIDRLRGSRLLTLRGDRQMWARSVYYLLLSTCHSILICLQTCSWVYLSMSKSMYKHAYCICKDYIHIYIYLPLTSPTRPSDIWPCWGLQLKVEALSPSVSSFSMSSALSTMSFSWSMKISFSNSRIKPFSTCRQIVFKMLNRNIYNQPIDDKKNPCKMSS